MFVFESCRTWVIRNSIWGCSQCVGSYRIGCACWISVCALQLDTATKIIASSNASFRNSRKYLPLTANWSFLMSILSFVPAASVFVVSWADWHQIIHTHKSSWTCELHDMFTSTWSCYWTLVGGLADAT